MPPDKVNLNAFESRLRTIFFPHIAIDPHRLALARAVDCQLQRRFFHSCSEYARELGGVARQIDWLIGRLHAARFDPREVEQRIDELQ